MATVAFNLRLDTRRDADLIAWLDLLVASGESKSDFARRAMRREMRDDTSLGDILREVKAVRDLLAAGVHVVGAAAGGNGSQAADDGDGVDLDILDNLAAIGA